MVLVRSALGARDLRPALTSRISGIAGAQVLGRDGVQAQQAAQQRLNAGIQYLAMALIIAFTIIAVLNELVMAALDRSREFALLRMIGATRSPDRGRRRHGHEPRPELGSAPEVTRRPAYLLLRQNGGAASLRQGRLADFVPA